jgi:hypothetical protein
MQDNWSNLDKLKLFPWVGHANRQNYEIVTIFNEEKKGELLPFIQLGDYISHFFILIWNA